MDAVDARVTNLWKIVGTARHGTPICADSSVITYVVADSHTDATHLAEQALSASWRSKHFCYPEAVTVLGVTYDREVTIVA